MPEKIVFVRHGIAEVRSATGSDHDRKLLAQGVELLEKAYPEYFPQLLDDGLPITVLASEAVRTQQTAQIICDVLGVPYDSIVNSRALTAQNRTAIRDEVRQAEGIVVAVGHHPSVDDVMSEMSGRMRTMLRGEAVCLDTSGRRAKVVWDCKPR